MRTKSRRSRPQVWGRWLRIKIAPLGGPAWVYALREFCLIVAGILVALSINNWNDARKLRINEVKMLRELRATLQNDLRDIESNIEFLNITRQGKQVLIDSEKTGYHDSLHRHLNSLLYDQVYLMPNRGAFESLKSAGLSLITNDSVRLALVNLYEYDYKVQEANEKRQNEHTYQKANEFARVVMELREDSVQAPARYRQLFNNTDFKVILYQAYHFDNFKFNQNQFFKTRVQKIIAQIEAEVARLE
ncbi:MAG: DUF6090 family protein [Bernardetiaceae bacterium]|jgi:hypothetical protein|nr:DUF6090 family protein [Bernardetiaceae bacterium]